MIDDEKGRADRNKSTHARHRSNSTKKRKKKKRIFLKLFFVLLILGCTALIAGAGVFYYYAKEAPKLRASKLEDSSSSRFFDIKGTMFYELGEKKRETVAVDDTPQQLKNAVTSIEDKRFEKHIGVDPIRIAGAAFSNIKGNHLQGGSTLTQQLIKLSYFSTKEEDQTIGRKAQEAWLSLQLERKASKDEILNYYINKVYMANGLYGMETAAKTYYGKVLEDLSLAQTALLAGMPQAPNDYDPYTHPKEATKRRDLVLSEMFKDKKIDSKDYNVALGEPIDNELKPLEGQSGEKKIIDNYVKQVIEEVEKKTKKNIYTDGMDIYTNIDMDAQKYLYKLVNSDEYIDFPDDKFQTAITVIDVKTGQVKAQIGGRKVPDDVQLGENRAVTNKRDFGSTTKPITSYAPAIEYLNYSTAQTVVDEPYKYPGTNKWVNNYDMTFKGAMSIREALVDSRNVPAIKTLSEVGIDKSQEFLKGLGITYKSEEFQLSKAISGDPSSLQMAAAYAAFANGGLYYTPYYVDKIVYLDGKEEKFEPHGTRAMKDSTAYMMTDILKEVLKRGTGTLANIPNLPQAGKTGTSNYENKDNVEGDVYMGVPDISFVGYTSNYAISIWTGYDNFNHAISYKDQQIAMYLYKYLMGHISQNMNTPDWKIPSDVVKIGNQLYVKDHLTDQGSTWTEPNYNWNYGYYGNYSSSDSSSSSSSEEPSSTPPSSSSVAPPPSSSAPPASAPPVTPEPPTSVEKPPPAEGGEEIQPPG